MRQAREVRGVHVGPVRVRRGQALTQLSHIATHCLTYTTPTPRQPPNTHDCSNTTPASMPPPTWISNVGQGPGAWMMWVGTCQVERGLMAYGSSRWYRLSSKPNLSKHSSTWRGQRQGQDHEGFNGKQRQTTANSFQIPRRFDVREVALSAWYHALVRGVSQVDRRRRRRKEEGNFYYY